MLYPQKINAKNGDLIIRIMLASSIIIAITLVIINKVTNPNVHWGALCNAGIVYIWTTVIYSIKKNTNIAGQVLLQTIAISIFTIYIDYVLGFEAWSVNYILPVIIIIANITMLILTIISYKKYIRYAIYQLIIILLSMLPMLLIYEKIIQNKTLNYIAVSISIINLIITIILCKNAVKEVIIRKFHI